MANLVTSFANSRSISSAVIPLVKSPGLPLSLAVHVEAQRLATLVFGRDRCIKLACRARFAA
jgi:hypothetical protein